MSSGPVLQMLFVCVENSNRSQMAEAFARLHAGESVRAFSAGSRPSGKVNPLAITAMAELGYDLSVHRSKSLNEVPDLDFDLVATMGCGDECPAVRSKRREDWVIPDPREMNADEFREIRDLIASKVQAAIESLRNS